LLTVLAEEFNKYLSYVRNLGFEDTPDYDFLRDLFTQAAKNAHELEDGEYDWMKLNGGRGWESKSSAAANHHHGVNVAPEASNRALVGAPGVRGVDGRPSKSDARGAISADRLNAAQPPPPGSPAKPGQAALGKTPRDRGNVSGAGANLPKRSSGLAGQLNAATPSASMQAQMQTSNLDLASPNRPSPATGALQSSQARLPNGQQQEPQPTFFQKLMKALCCGASR
jgi:casein kinase 1